MKLCERFFPLVLFAVLLLPVIAFAQGYPEKTVRVLIAFPPGGSTDIVARIVFQKMPEITGQQFVIDNRGGAAGTIAAALLAKSPPDGYTIMTHSATHISNGHLRKVPYHTLNDFIGVTPVARQVFILAVHPSMPVRSVKEFIALAKKRPGQILYGSGGNATPLHLGMALFNSATGTKMVHVQYKGGGPAAVSLVAGESQAMMANIGVLFEHIKAKRVRPVAVSSAQRVTQFPDIPAIAETVPGFDFTAWIGVFAPAGTPKAVVDKLNADLKKAVADPGVASKLSNQTLDPMYTTPEEFSRLLKSDYEKYGKIIRETGARND